MSLHHAMRKAYRSTEQGKLDRLLSEESRWKRKLTIASNKLAEVRGAITGEAKRLAAQVDMAKFDLAKPGEDKSVEFAKPD